MKRLQTYRAPGITVTFDPNTCIHSAVCLNALPAVFDVRRKEWIRAGAAAVREIAATIERCPSGALKYVLEETGSADSKATEQAAHTTIQTSRNGPLLVQGAFALVDETGAVIPASSRIALCRCGQTQNQPFCDGSHRAAGFESKRPAAT